LGLRDESDPQLGLRADAIVRPGALTALVAQLAHAPIQVAPPLLVPGARVGRYEIIRAIGRGGFGTVYEAHDAALNRLVALKALHRSSSAAPGAASEGEAAARLAHPNIAALYDAGVIDGGLAYLVYEILHGETLESRLARGPIPPGEVVAIAAQVARALWHAHTHGVVHRDLKPANVFLTAEGDVKVLDFGMALLFGRTAPAGGTPAYMAPEQRRGEPEDARTDLYALGALLREMLTGERDVSSEWRARVPLPIGRFLAALLAEDPAARPRSARVAIGELEAAARAFAAPRPRRRRFAAERPPGMDGDADRDLRSVRGTSIRMPAIPATLRRRPGVWLLSATGAVLAAALAVWLLQRLEPARENPLADARFLQLTDFDGIEQSAAISRDGRFVAFQSDRDGRMDVWVTQIGTGQYFNLTRGSAPEIVNPSVRTLGFSPDGTLVTFWARGRDGSNQPDISVWAAPLLGGQPRPYLDGVAEFDWSSDGARLAYHTPGPGDPMFVRDSGQPSEARKIFSAPPGLHSHFLLWSPDRAFIYFVQGSLPDRMDIWRIKPTGGTPERVTHHDSLVSHPVFLNARTLLYLVTDSDGFGPWIHSLDVDRRIPRRVSFGVDSYTSLAVSADGRRIVATMASPKGTLWRMPITSTPVEMSAARRIPLTTRNGSSPRLGPDYLLYVSSKGVSDSIWKLQGGMATELWSAPETQIVGAPAIARDGRRIAFSIKRSGRTILYVVNADGTDARIVTGALQLEGAPAWTPDGQSITVAAVVDGMPRLFSVPLDGRSPAPFVAEHSVDPVWSPDGDIVAFSGADVGTTFPVKAVKADASAYRLPALTLTRGARHLSFMPERRSLMVLRGEIRHKNLWQIDLETGIEQQVTDLAPDFDVRDFDVSPDGGELVLEQVQQQSDIVLIELPRR
jgi:Tol biopolymer transport system component